MYQLNEAEARLLFGRKYFESGFYTFFWSEEGGWDGMGDKKHLKHKY